jgi:hypothetical protein
MIGDHNAAGAAAAESNSSLPPPTTTTKYIHSVGEFVVALVVPIIGCRHTIGWSPSNFPSPRSSLALKNGSDGRSESEKFSFRARVGYHQSRWSA